MRRSGGVLRAEAEPQLPAARGGADVAVYDVAAVSPEFLLRLTRSRCRATLVFAHDEMDAAGRHRPVDERAFRGGRPRDIASCFGSR